MKLHTLLVGVAFAGLYPCASHATEDLSSSMTNMPLCEAQSKYSLSGSFEPFEKDPAAFSLGKLGAGDGLYVIAVDTRAAKPGCGKVLAAMKVSDLRSPDEDIGLNCAVLNEKFDRQKTYIGIHPMDGLEYSRTRLAWTFDFTQFRFVSYPQPENIFCANFQAD
jgi:hypothetical protein